jgi:hypothetical protein
VNCSVKSFVMSIYFRTFGISTVVKLSYLVVGFTKDGKPIHIVCSKSGDLFCISMLPALLNPIIDPLLFLCK